MPSTYTAQGALTNCNLNKRLNSDACAAASSLATGVALSFAWAVNCESVEGFVGEVVGGL